ARADDLRARFHGYRQPRAGPERVGRQRGGANAVGSLLGVRWPILHRDYARGRLQQAAERMRAVVYPEARAPDTLLVSRPVGYLTSEEAKNLGYETAQLGIPLGPPWATVWFRIEAAIPETWAGRR